MGVVYHARDTILNRDVAVKRMLPRLLADEASQKRFLHEAQAQSRLKHRNIVSVYSADRDQFGPWVVLEWVDGQSLQEWSLEHVTSWPRNRLWMHPLSITVLISGRSRKPCTGC
ncbi:MAG: protein kinase domain-containing protein [Planctomycetota bacterium]